MDWALLGGVFCVCAIAAWVATGAILRLLRRWQVLDKPNTRSSHARPTPRGGGLALLAVVLPALVVAPLLVQPVAGIWYIVAGTLLVAIVSWIDDLRGLGAGPRLASHVVAATVGLAALPHDALVWQGILGWWPDRVVTALVWIWFVNLFNFMDGIDGIAGVETSAIGIGVVAAAAVAPLGPALAMIGAACAGAAVGFLRWNWHPAKVFLGDVGSIPIGYLLGWLLIAMAVAGTWAPAIILPLYFIADATLTLGLRVIRREKFWRAHREHFYQRAVEAGRSHAWVATMVGLANVGLIGLAVFAALGYPLPAIAAAVILVAALLMVLSRPARRNATAG